MLPLALEGSANLTRQQNAKGNRIATSKTFGGRRMKGRVAWFCFLLITIAIMKPPEILLKSEVLGGVQQTTRGRKGDQGKIDSVCVFSRCHMPDVLTFLTVP